VAGTGNSSVFRHSLRVPESHTFWRNAASRYVVAQHALKSATEFEPFLRVERQHQDGQSEIGSVPDDDPVNAVEAARCYLYDEAHRAPSDRLAIQTPNSIEKINATSSNARGSLAIAVCVSPAAKTPLRPSPHSYFSIPLRGAF
jgi:hypothetical protein